MKESIGIKIIIGIVAVLGLSGAGVIIGGLGSVTSFWEDIPGLDTDMLGIDWALIGLEVFAMVYLPVMVFLKRPVSIQALLACFTAPMMIRTHEVVLLIDQFSGNKKDRLQVTCAGYIIVMVTNLLLIIVLGNTDFEPRESSSRKEVPEGKGEIPAEGVPADNKV